MFSGLHRITIRVKHRVGSVRTVMDDVRSDYDIMLSDIYADVLKNISEKKLGVEYQSLTEEEPKYPVNGTIYGEKGRQFINLIVDNNTVKRNVLFLVVSGCPDVFMASETMKLFFDDNRTQSYMNVHGVSKILVSKSPADSHFSHMNLLGQKFLYQSDLTMISRVSKGILTLTKED